MVKKLLELKNVSKTFPGVQALNKVGFTIRKGEIHALLGENGAGKSTLIKILTGVYQPDQGSSIILNGREWFGFTPLEALQNEIAVIYQDFSLFPNLSVMENIAMEQCIKDNRHLVNWRETRRTAVEALARLSVDIKPESILGDLSVARQQLVAIARALVNKARLLILDEPTSALSSKEVERLFEIMLSLRKENISLLFITHKLDEVFAVSDRLTVLRDGAYVGSYNKSEISEKKLISLMVGRDIEYKIFPKRQQKEPLLELRNLSKKGNFRDISFTLHEGEIYGLTGLVGAGRTELAESIFGLAPADSGSFLLKGKEIKIQSPQDAVQAGFSLIPENRLLEGLILSKSIEDNISLNSLDTLSSPLSLINRNRKKNLADKWIKKLAIRPAIPHMPTSALSGGNQQRVVISRCLATKPEILIVDEPTNGVDIGAKAEIHQILRNLAEDGLGIIVISSELPEILAVTDRVGVMRRGRLVAEFPCNNVSQEEIMAKAV